MIGRPRVDCFGLIYEYSFLNVSLGRIQLNIGNNFDHYCCSFVGVAILMGGA